MAERPDERISDEEHDTRMNEVDTATGADPGEASDYVDKTALPRNDAPTGLAAEAQQGQAQQHTPLPRRDS